MVFRSAPGFAILLHMEKPLRKPGDILLNRYCAELTGEDREAAREVFRELAEALFDLELRCIQEGENADSPPSVSQGIL